jgi:hypothetical protein
VVVVVVVVVVAVLQSLEKNPGKGRERSSLIPTGEQVGESEKRYAWLNVSVFGLEPVGSLGRCPSVGCRRSVRPGRVCVRLSKANAAELTGSTRSTKTERGELIVDKRDVCSWYVVERSRRRSVASSEADDGRGCG